MTSIQGILIAGFIVAAIAAARIFRTKLLYRLVALALFLTAPVLIIFPDFTTVIAHALGVGRGTDLLLYFALVGGIYVALLLYLRIRELDQKIAQLTRSIALRDAAQIKSAPEKDFAKSEAVTRP